MLQFTVNSDHCALNCSCDVEESIECDIGGLCDVGGFLPPRFLDAVLGGVGFDVVLGGVGFEDEVGGVKIDLSFFGDGGWDEVGVDDSEAAADRGWGGGGGGATNEELDPRRMGKICDPSGLVMLC